MNKVVVAVTGASGSIYARLLLVRLLAMKDQYDDLAMVMTENAKQVLQKVKANAAWSEIPVVILSDSDQDIYKNECYALGAASFIKKPGNIKDTSSKIATFFKYWFEVAEV